VNIKPIDLLKVIIMDLLDRKVHQQKQILPAPIAHHPIPQTHLPGQTPLAPAQKQDPLAQIHSSNVNSPAEPPPNGILNQPQEHSLPKQMAIHILKQLEARIDKRQLNRNPARRINVQT
jgi:hypothetical protein